MALGFNSGNFSTYEPYAVQASQQYGVPLNILNSQIYQESGWNQNSSSGGILTSAAGALGIGQFLPGTATQFGVNVNDPVSSIFGTAKADAQYYNTYGDWGTALAAYNAGPGNVNKYGGIPPFSETQQYVSNILGGVGSSVMGSVTGGSGILPSNSGTASGGGVSGTINNILSWLGVDQLGGIADADAAAYNSAIGGAASTPAGSALNGALGSAGNAIGSQITGAFDKIGSQIAPILLRSGFGIFGVVLIVIALVALLASNKQVQQVAATAVAA